MKIGLKKGDSTSCQTINKRAKSLAENSKFTAKVNNHIPAIDQLITWCSSRNSMSKGTISDEKTTRET